MKKQRRRIAENHTERTMKDKYIDLIEQSFDFPQDEFSVEDNELNFHDIPLMELIKQYGTPLKITYLPKISQQINRAKRMFNVAMAKVDYKGSYNYCYCEPSRAISRSYWRRPEERRPLETSSAYDIHIINASTTAASSTKTVTSSATASSARNMWKTSRTLCNGFHNIIPMIGQQGGARTLRGLHQEMQGRHPHRLRGGTQVRFLHFAVGRALQRHHRFQDYKDCSRTARSSSSRCCISSSTRVSKTRLITGTS